VFVADIFSHNIQISFQTLTIRLEKLRFSPAKRLFERKKGFL
jgi:hypothetical protein